MIPATNHAEFERNEEKMMNRVFSRASFLLPQACDMNKWSVVACDQFSSQPEYWDALEKECAGIPSTLHLMFPEAYLSTRDQFEEALKINAEMDKYLAEGVFCEISDSYVYVERTLKNGAVRRGLMGVLDLDAYDYSKESASPIRATEGTIEERLPPRVRVREGASLEMPHIMVFIDDPAESVMTLLEGKTDEMPKLYDFDLCAGGGHIRGWQVCGKNADVLEETMDALADPETLKKKYGDAAPAIFAMGDGNHSLATAKKCWEKIKAGLNEKERENHPARFGLVEIVNIHEKAVTFEPIHKVLFETEPSAFLEEATAWFSACSGKEKTSHTLRLVTGTGEKSLTVHGLTIGQIIGTAEEFCQKYLAAHGGKIDYIHNDDTAIEMGTRTDGAAVLLPKMEKGELFPSIISSGPFPKKSFSIGHAEDKRYYLECRKIK